MGEKINIPGYVEYLDLTHPYLVLVPKNDEGLDLLYDAHIYSDCGKINEKLEYMQFNEKQFLLLEKYLFNFLCDSCDLIITMYEEEWVEGEKLIDVLSITNQAINNSDNQEFIILAKRFRELVQMAIELKTSLVFYF